MYSVQMAEGGVFEKKMRFTFLLIKPDQVVHKYCKHIDLTYQSTDNANRQPVFKNCAYKQSLRT